MEKRVKSKIKKRDNSNLTKGTPPTGTKRWLVNGSISKKRCEISREKKETQMQSRPRRA